MDRDALGLIVVVVVAVVGEHANFRCPVFFVLRDIGLGGVANKDVVGDTIRGLRIILRSGAGGDGGGVDGGGGGGCDAIREDEEDDSIG